MSAMSATRTNKQPRQCRSRKCGEGGAASGVAGIVWRRRAGEDQQGGRTLVGARDLGVVNDAAREQCEPDQDVGYVSDPREHLRRSIHNALATAHGTCLFSLHECMRAAFLLHLGQRRGESQRLHLRCLCLAAATDLGCLRDPASAAPRTLARSMQPSRAREQSAASCEKLARGRLPFSSAVCARCGLMAARLPKAKAIGRIANVARTLPLRSAPDLRFVGERVWSWGWQIGTACRRHERERSAVSAPPLALGLSEHRVACGVATRSASRTAC